MSAPEYFTFKITDKGWWISKPHGYINKFKLEKINKDVEKLTHYTKYNNSNINFTSSDYNLGTIKSSYLFKRRKENMCLHIH